MVNNIMQQSEKVLWGALIASLVGFITVAVAGWQLYYFTYAFFISWGLLLLLYALQIFGYYSLIIIGMAAGALGVYFSTTGSPGADAALLTGRITLGVFTCLLGWHLYTARSELGNNTTVFAGLLLALLVQVAFQNIENTKAISLQGIANYFTVALVGHIHLNDHLGKFLTTSQKRILLAQVVFCSFQIALSLIDTLSFD